jgi:hypothetical protein
LRHKGSYIRNSRIFFSNSSIAFAAVCFAHDVACCFAR